MQIDFKHSVLLKIEICFFLIMRVVVSFNVFAFMKPVSYLVLGICCLNFLLMLSLFVRSARITLFGLFASSYFFLLLVFTLLNGTDLATAVYRSIEVLLFLLIMNYYSEDLTLVLKTCAFALSIAIYVNLAIMILFPDWMFVAVDSFDSFLLGGNYNQMGGRMICGILTSLMCVPFSKKWLLNVIALILTSIITLVLVGSMTALSCISMFAFFCLIPSLRLQKIGIIAFLVFYLFFQIVVVFSGEGLHNNELAVYIIEDLLQKDMTFTNRTEMWDAAGKLFAESPIYGYGCVDADWYVATMSSFAIGPHNFIYSVLINGGVILLTILIVIFVIAFHRLQGLFDKISCLLTMGLLTFMFMMTMEVYPFFFVLYLLSFIFYYDEIRRLYPANQQSAIVDSDSDIQSA